MLPPGSTSCIIQFKLLLAPTEAVQADMVNLSSAAMHALTRSAICSATF
jgi:hypothetical protein